MMEIKIREATLQDCDILLEWRNDEATRAASHNIDLVEYSSHIRWLRSSLANPNRVLFIAEADGVPVGSVRTDFDGLETELSWTVAPKARGKGVAKNMVKVVYNSLSGPIRAAVKIDNIASASVAQHVGMEVVEEVDGILYFRSHV